MILPLQTFTVLMQNMAASVQGGAVQLLDLSIGSVLRAMLEACASIAMWLQWLILQVLSMTRAATSNGTDLDSWMADFSLTRLPGTPSTGLVNFSCYTSGLATVIPVGTTVTTSDGTQSFTVIAQTNNLNWNGSSGYTLASTLASVSVPVQATAPGVARNILTGAIAIIGSAIPGVDTVSNAMPFVGGRNAESDSAFRLRFQSYINSRSLATAGSVDFAVASLQEGLRYSVIENATLAGISAPGNFCVIVDDGSGYPPSSLISAASTAVEAVRPIGSTYAVFPPSVLPVSIQMTVTSSSPLTEASVGLLLQQAIQAWIAALPMAGLLAISKIDAIAHAVDSSVVSVRGTSINGGTSDVTASASEVFIASGVVVNWA